MLNHGVGEPRTIIADNFNTLDNDTDNKNIIYQK